MIIRQKNHFNCGAINDLEIISLQVLFGVFFNLYSSIFIVKHNVKKNNKNKTKHVIDDTCH